MFSSPSRTTRSCSVCSTLWITCLLLFLGGLVTEGEVRAQEGQRLASHAARLTEALESIGHAFSQDLQSRLARACNSQDAAAIESLLDSEIACTVTINPESRVKVTAGPTQPKLVQAGYTPWLVKIVNQGAVKSNLRVESAQAGPSYSGTARLSMQRQEQLQLLENQFKPGDSARFLHLTWHELPPMSTVPTGVALEYAILLIYSSDSGNREAVFEFSVGSGTQDLGFRAQLPTTLSILPAIPVRISARDESGQGCFAKLTIRDQAGHVHPPQTRRVGEDFFFQQQIYRNDGESVLLAPGNYTVEVSQGPETILESHSLSVLEGQSNRWEFRIRRWIEPMKFGWYSGDHHIHGAGCAHYTSPTEGVTPDIMFRQVAGEGLNVGCVLTWGPCFEFQRNFFRPEVDRISRDKTLLKYDIEISGFGSQALGHVCLLNLRDQYYPGSDGTKEKGWPTWTTPALRWAKAQGAVTGFAHSGSGLQIDPAKASQRLINQLDSNRDALLTREESTTGLLPLDFEKIDQDHDRRLSQVELEIAIDMSASRLPNLAVPEMNSVGAMELPVAVVEGVCDFISTMDTARISEWNMWYHILNCGYSLKASGETDFPCMSSNVVGQGRVYVQLGDIDRIDFSDWCRGLALGQSYVSDGYIHSLRFQAQSADDFRARSGERIDLAQPANITITTSIAAASRMPQSIAYATKVPDGMERFVGDTVTAHGTMSRQWVDVQERWAELVINGEVAEKKKIPCDAQVHDLAWNVRMDRSSWIAVRVFPHMHTNPIEVIIDKQPIRASRASALWCAETIKQLWTQRQNSIAQSERAAAKMSFDSAIAEYQRRAFEAMR